MALRFCGLVAVFATVGISVGHRAAIAQSPKPAESPLRQWFSSPPADAHTAAEKRPNPPQNIPIHYLRQTICNIPFTVDGARGGPIELHLYVSRNGSDWRFFNRTPPNTGSFNFRVNEDGEYWFALRTIEKNQAAFDPKTLQPGLRVVFDTQPPQLQFEAVPHSEDSIALRWSASDPWLDSESLRVEYQSGPDESWQTLSMPKNGAVAAKQATGQQVLPLQSHAAAVLVRAEVRDKAGNNTVVSRQVNLRESFAARNGTPNRDRATTGSDGSVAWPQNNVIPPRPPTNGNSNPNSFISNSGKNLPAPVQSDLPPPRPSVEPPRAVVDTLRNPYFPTAVRNDGASPVESVEAGSREPLPSPVAPFNGIPISSPLPNDPPMALQSPLTHGRAKDPVKSFPSVGDSSPVPTPVNLPAGDRPRMTNSQQFSLDYEVEAIGPASVERVELWGTPDGGRTWTRWQEDEDRLSPVDVKVGRDGTYGFRVVVLTTHRLATPAPQPGEPADIWVGVDSTRPSVRITGAPYGEGEHMGQLDIHWQAFDTGFGDRPVTLSFSEQANGPWSVIAAGLPNTGQYYWAVEPRIPREIYLRLEAIDEAGNKGEHRTTEPISTAGLIPHAKIRGLRVPSTNNHSASREMPTR